MPELHFKGKEFVYNHHLTVPYRPLETQPDKSIGEDSGNLIIHGDNLHALKALMPHYAGRVDCIFIDPPYNTGNENWSYNDNVNSPIIREWLSSNPINREDMLRHDKWACLMYPRLKLLHELLSERGSLWMTLDDNEIHHARMILDDIFGAENFVASFVWKKMDSPSRNASDRAISAYHDHIIVYSADIEELRLHQESRESILEAYPLVLPDGRRARRRQLRKNGKNARREDRRTMWYKLEAPDGSEVWPVAPEGWEGRWVLSFDEWNRRTAQGRTEWIKRETGWVPYYIEVAPKEPKAPWSTIWDDVGQNRQAKAELTAIMGREVNFETPKPTALVERVLEIATEEDSIVVDSFAGSGTTAHAVLSLNAKDGGNRKFLLVECEDYADTLTAERVRRIISGYDFEGTQKEELLRQKVSFTTLKDAPKLLREIEHIEQVKGKKFDKITKNIKDDTLLVVGEKKITERTEGLGGGFTYCELGLPLDLDKLLTGELLPDYRSLGAWLFHTATGGPLDRQQVLEDDWYLGDSPSYHVWLIYRPDLDWLKSRDAALTLTLAEKIAASSKDKRHLVFAPARFVASKHLLPLGVEHAPLPFALYRFEKD